MPLGIGRLFGKGQKGRHHARSEKGQGTKIVVPAVKKEVSDFLWGWEIPELISYLSTLIHKLFLDSPKAVVPEVSFSDPFSLYCEAVKTEREKERKQGPEILAASRASRKGQIWGQCILTTPAPTTFLLAISEPMIFLVSSEASSVKLLYLAEQMVAENCAKHHVLDIRLLHCWITHQEKIPANMKNGETYIFAGTIVTIASEPHVPGIVWSGGGFKEVLISLVEPYAGRVSFVLVNK